MAKRILFACVVLCGAPQLLAEANAQASSSVKSEAVNTQSTPAAKTEEAKTQEAAPAVKSENSVLYVKVEEAMLGSKQGADAQKAVEAEEKKYAEMAQKAQQDMIKVKTDLDQKASMMSPEARRTQEKKLGDMQRDFQNNMNDWKYELQFTMQRETDAIMKDIEVAAKDLAVKTGKKAVIDVQTGRALYLHDDLNSTDQLISMMDTSYDAKKKAKAPTSAPAA